MLLLLPTRTAVERGYPIKQGTVDPRNSPTASYNGKPENDAYPLYAAWQVQLTGDTGDWYFQECLGILWVLWLTRHMKLFADGWIRPCLP